MVLAMDWAKCCVSRHGDSVPKKETCMGDRSRDTLPASAEHHKAMSPIRSFSQTNHVGVRNFLEPPAGVGIIFAQNEDLILRVDSVTPGGAASRSGLIREGDELYAVEGTTVQGLTIEHLANLVLGPAGSHVHMEFARGIDRYQVRITRQHPKPSSIPSPAAVRPPSAYNGRWCSPDTISSEPDPEPPSPWPVPPGRLSLDSCPSSLDSSRRSDGGSPLLRGVDSCYAGRPTAKTLPIAPKPPAVPAVSSSNGNHGSANGSAYRYV